MGKSIVHWTVGEVMGMAFYPHPVNTYHSLTRRLCHGDVDAMVHYLSGAEVVKDFTPLSVEGHEGVTPLLQSEE